MGDVGTFPFGWVRAFKGDNWQIIWDPKTRLIIAQAAVSGEVVRLGESSVWMEAKTLADNIMSNPEPYFDETAVTETG